MDVSNYNVALAKNRSNYQKTLDQAKEKHSDELIKSKDHADYNFKKLQKDKIREKTLIEQDFSTKLKDNQKKLHKEISESKLENATKLSSQKHQSVQDSMKNQEAYKRELSKIKGSYEGSKDNIPQQKYNNLERKLGQKDGIWMEKISTINESNDSRIKDIHKTFIKQKQSLVKNTEDKIETTTKDLKKTFASRNEKTIDNYERRIEAKTRENQNLMFRLNTLAKKLATRFNKELSHQLEQKDHILKKERESMNSRLEEKDLNFELKLAESRRRSEAKLHEISIRNNKLNDEIVRRYERKIDNINQTNKKELESKVGLLEAKHENLKRAHKMEIATMKEFQDQKQQQMEDRISAGKTSGVRVVSKL